MKSRREFRQGGPHALIICWLLAAVGLALFFPAPGRAFGDTLVKEADGLPTKGALPPQFGQAVRGIFGDFSLAKPAENPANRTIAESSSAAEESARSLTEEEYDQLKRMLSTAAATPSQVGLTNAAVKGTNVLLVGLPWVILLLILRSKFDFWFDKDVYDNTWASVAVICTVIICTAHLLGKALS